MCDPLNMPGTASNEIGWVSPGWPRLLVNRGRGATSGFGAAPRPLVRLRRPGWRATGATYNASFEGGSWTGTIAAIIVSLFLPGECQSGDDFPDDLRQWIATEPPQLESERWWAAENNFEYEWVVSLRDGQPRVDRRDVRSEEMDPLPFVIEPGSSREGLAGRRYAIRVIDGWLVGFNGGEFGAGLWWFSPDGSQRVKLGEAWINGFLRTETGIWAIEGLAHGADDSGQLLRMVHAPGGRWQAERSLDLGQAPEVLAEDADGRFIVATSERLIRVDPAAKTITTLIEEVFWQGLYPNSMVVTPAGTIFIGMRHGVAKIEPGNDGHARLHWLLPNQSFVDLKPVEGFK